MCAEAIKAAGMLFMYFSSLNEPVNEAYQSLCYRCALRSWGLGQGHITSQGVAELGCEPRSGRPYSPTTLSHLLVKWVKPISRRGRWRGIHLFSKAFNDTRLSVLSPYYAKSPSKTEQKDEKWGREGSGMKNEQTMTRWLLCLPLLEKWSDSVVVF